MKQRTYPLSLSLNGSQHVVDVTHKTMKTLRLRVMPTGEIRLSVPNRCSRASIDTFLNAQKPWLAEKLAEYEARFPEGQRPFSIVDGASLRVLGREYSVVLRKGRSPSITLAGHLCIVTAPAPEDSAALARQFRRWWREKAMDCYEDALDRYYPPFAALGIPRPSLHIRSMRSRWGSCNYQRGRINLNAYLYATLQACVDYVVLHELAHLVHHRHDRGFYGLLGDIMPDWRAREALLDEELIPKGF